MVTVSVHDFRTGASTILDRVQSGETIEVSRDGQVVAEIRPKTAILTGEPRKAAIAKLNELLDNKFGVYAGSITYEDKYGDADL